MIEYILGGAVTIITALILRNSYLVRKSEKLSEKNEAHEIKEDISEKMKVENKRLKEIKKEAIKRADELTTEQKRNEI